jgi:hypothetical protein
MLDYHQPIVAEFVIFALSGDVYGICPGYSV